MARIRTSARALAAAALGLAGCTSPDPTGPSNVVAGVFEPDYLYPWTVALPSCRGVLLNAKWVLTAAHCITSVTDFNVTVTRTDPSGTLHQEQRTVDGDQGVFVHPDFDILKTISNDIALVRLSQPLEIAPHIQSVGLPPDARHDGTVGTVAGIPHTGMLPPGQLMVFRAPIDGTTPAQQFSIFATVASGSLCPGDSGSGFVTLENGRAVVRGVLSQAFFTDCMTNGNFQNLFIDVFHYRGWILDTMRVNDFFLDGNTRLRWSGPRAARGVMGIGCNNDFGTMWGPLYVRGVQEGANCETEQTQTVICSLESGQPDTRFTAFTMKTTLEDGTVVQENLPFTDRLAAYYGELPFSSAREFNCRVGSSIFDFGSVGELEATDQ